MRSNSESSVRAGVLCYKRQLTYITGLPSAFYKRAMLEVLFVGVLFILDPGQPNLGLKSQMIQSKKLDRY